MQRTKWLVCSLMFPAALFSQAPQTPPAPAPQVVQEPVYVRRFSAGITASASVLNPFRANDETQIIDSPPTEIQSKPTSRKRPFGYGLNVQLAINNRLAINAGFLIRKMAYENFTATLVGVDNPNTFADERQGTNVTEYTTANFYDVPVLLRYYGKDRRDDGPRWFLEGGATARKVAKIHSQITTKLPNMDPVETQSQAPLKKNLFGVTGGLGFQFIDPFGIRVVPEVRYTRWFSSVRDDITIRSRRDQAEIVLSFTF